ncbi:unnamed protein product [Oikopleura dioica]|uniref:Uncharacterized protein n=1 Tax=Oikopleura dioica TaxID=34765 RepID=E4XXV9_OIKDI|nr:unnamed protein product [Oikopleura dioica]
MEKALVDQTSALDPTEFIYAKLKDSTCYDRRIRPNAGITPKNVNVSLYVSSIDSITETTMDYRMTVFLRMRWIDPRNFRKVFLAAFSICKLQPANFCFRHGIWIPDLFFFNEKKAAFHEIITQNRLLRISPNGSIYVSIRISIVLSCHMQLEKFPMDMQQCYIQAESFGYNMNDLAFKWSADKSIDMPGGIALPQFKIMGHKLADCTKSYTSGQYTCLRATFVLKREIGYYMIQIYIPSFLIVVLSWVSFWIAVEATPARVSLGITTVLTITSMRSEAGSSLPKVSYVKAIDIWLSLCMAFVFAALLEFAVANYLSRQKNGILYKNSIRTYELKQLLQKIISRTDGKNSSNGNITRRNKHHRKQEKNNYKHRSDLYSNGVSTMNNQLDPYYENKEEYYVEYSPEENIQSIEAELAKAKKENKEAKEYYKKLSTRLEIECRILFPLSFFGFLVCYIVYYYFITDDSTTVMQGMTPYDEFAEE